MVRYVWCTYPPLHLADLTTPLLLSFSSSLMLPSLTGRVRLLLDVLVSDVLPQLALVVVLPDLVHHNVKADAKGKGACKDGGYVDRVPLEEVGDGAGESR